MYTFTAILRDADGRRYSRQYIADSQHLARIQAGNDFGDENVIDVVECPSLPWLP